MSDGALVPVKSGGLPETSDATLDVMAIWEADLEATPRAQLVAFRDGADAAVKSGQASAAGLALVTPASPRDVAVIMAELISAFPQEKKNDLRTFSKFLAEDVASLGASRPALIAAARAIRRTSTFLSSIAEVMAAVESQKAQCVARAALIARLPKRISEITALLGE
jgi:hypothetical protein